MSGLERTVMRIADEFGAKEVYVMWDNEDGLWNVVMSWRQIGSEPWKAHCSDRTPRGAARKALKRARAVVLQQQAQQAKGS